MRAASLKLGTNDSLVKDWLNRGHTPGIDDFCRLAELLGVSPLFLLQGHERFEVKVPLAGISTRAEKWTPFAEPAKGKVPEMADFSFGGDVFAIEVRGDEMSPVYRDRDQLFCRRSISNRLDEMVGLDCAVRTADGESLIKILDKGSTAVSWTLRSYNPLSKPIANVVIAWAAPIIWVRRGGS